MKIKKGDNVVITAGRDRGKEGKVLRVFPGRDGREVGKVLVEKLNLLNRRIRPKTSGEKGQVVKVPNPLPASRVMIKCGKCGRGVRVGYRVEGEKKERICRRCGKVFN